MEPGLHPQWATCRRQETRHNRDWRRAGSKKPTSHEAPAEHQATATCPWHSTTQARRPRMVGRVLCPWQTPLSRYTRRRPAASTANSCRHVDDPHSSNGRNSTPISATQNRRWGLVVGKRWQRLWQVAGSDKQGAANPRPQKVPHSHWNTQHPDPRTHTRPRAQSPPLPPQRTVATDSGATRMKQGTRRALRGVASRCSA